MKPAFSYRASDLEGGISKAECLALSHQGRVQVVALQILGC